MSFYLLVDFLNSGVSIDGDGVGVNFTTSQVEDHMLPEPKNIFF